MSILFLFCLSLRIATLPPFGPRVGHMWFDHMRVSEEPVCIYLFRQNPVFTSLHFKYPFHVVLPRNNSLCSHFDPKKFSLRHFCSFCFDLIWSWTKPHRFLFVPAMFRIETRMVCFCFDPAEEGTSFSLCSCLYKGQLCSLCFDSASVVE